MRCEGKSADGEYGDAVECMDAEYWRVLETLEKLGGDNTLVAFHFGYASVVAAGAGAGKDLRQIRHGGSDAATWFPAGGSTWAGGGGGGGGWGGGGGGGGGGGWGVCAGGGGGVGGWGGGGGGGGRGEGGVRVADDRAGGLAKSPAGNGRTRLAAGLICSLRCVVAVTEIP